MLKEKLCCSCGTPSAFSVFLFSFFLHLRLRYHYQCLTALSFIIYIDVIQSQAHQADWDANIIVGLSWRIRNIFGHRKGYIAMKSIDTRLSRFSTSTIKAWNHLSSILLSNTSMPDIILSWCGGEKSPFLFSNQDRPFLLSNHTISHVLNQSYLIHTQDPETVLDETFFIKKERKCSADTVYLSTIIRGKVRPGVVEQWPCAT